MWIREKLEERSEGRLLSKGRVISSGKGLTVAGEENLRSPQVIAPYGFAFCLPVDQAVLTAEGNIIGVPMEISEELEPGEILIRNGFGAEIKLAADGAVTINGQRFERSDS